MSQKYICLYKTEFHLLRKQFLQPLTGPLPASNVSATQWGGSCAVTITTHFLASKYSKLVGEAGLLDKTLRKAKITKCNPNCIPFLIL